MDSKTFFQFKKTGIIIKRPWRMPRPGPYYPCLVPMDGIEGFPFDYALYFSTDHHKRNGGIWLYLCSGVPSDRENWKSYNKAVKDGDFDYIDKKPRNNPIYVDKVQGRHHTETPHVNIIGNKVYMSYHHCSRGGLQPTLLATSTDGVSFERIHGAEDSIILPAKPNGGHTGYFRWSKNPFHRVDYQYVGYSLDGGGDNY